MKIGFGTVFRFYDEKGFGFVSNIFDNAGSDGVFFHIKNIKKTHPRLVESIVNFGFPNNYRTGFLQPHWHEELNLDISEAPFFWFEIEHTDKGDKVKNILTENGLQNQLKASLPTLIEKTEFIWKDIQTSTPFHLQEASEYLLGIEGSIELRKERSLMIKQKLEPLTERRKTLDSLSSERLGIQLEINRLRLALPEEDYDDE